VIGIVAFSAMDSSGTRPSRWRSLGTNPTPLASVTGTLPGGTGRPATSTVPAPGARNPTRLSPTAIAPLAPPPASPTTSPARTRRSTSA
jgi:hypothetical protein